ncbi:MAG: Zn-dependent alcohol dehydrogenase [Acidimicrobiales bacterium]
MRAAVLHTIPGRPEVVEVEIAAPGAHEVLVRTAAAGLCGSELNLIDGRITRSAPLVLGHEAAGVVEAVGAEITGLAAGDHVVACVSVSCGACRFCLTGELWLCRDKARTARGPGEAPRLRLAAGGAALSAMGYVGAFAERMLVHERSLVRIPAEVPLDRAALLGCAVTTGIGAVQRAAGLRPGETAAVIGCGGVGLNVVQGARLAGAARIMAVDTSAEKLELARRFGATDLVLAADDPVAEVRRRSVGGVDHAFEAVGSPATVAQAFAMARAGGTAYVIGVLPEDAEVVLPASAFLEGRGVRGVYMGANRFAVDVPRYVELYRQGRLLLDELISQRIELHDVAAAYDRLRRGQAARAVIVF